MRHIAIDGGYKPCPECHTKTKVAYKLKEYGFPETFLNFTTTEDVANVLNSVLNNSTKAHFVVSLDKKSSVLSHLICGWFLRDEKVTYVDTAKVSPDHYNKDRKSIDTMFSVKGPILLQIGHEIETKIGMFYIKGFLDRAVLWGLPFVLLTPYRTDHTTMMVRYPELHNLLQTAGLSYLNHAL